jgi:hypothetical protein
VLTCFLLDVSQAGLELVSGGMGALLFSHLTWCGEALYGLWVQGANVLILLGAFFSAKCGSSFSVRFLIYRAHLSASASSRHLGTLHLKTLMILHSL